jgi:DNA-binding NtrC family response regulator
MMGSASIGLGRTVVLASADPALRQRLRNSLSGLRWQVREARGGAEAMAQLEDQPTEALLLDNWLPDLEVTEFEERIGAMYPDMELLRVDGLPVAGDAKSPRRHELLHALREAQGVSDRQGSTADAVSVLSERDSGQVSQTGSDVFSSELNSSPQSIPALQPINARISGSALRLQRSAAATKLPLAINEMIGESPLMIELARLIRLVAPRKATVLIEGETGTGKEVVAHALHRLSKRSQKPFVVLNCAAIPEALLEAELFGHTRGAFTGAVQSRTGRIEAAHGGTLFLDEIGEMPLALQAKMLRFLESGELQRVGDNETLVVDVRVVAATHQQLEARVANGTFRLDLYHRLAVFPLDVPPLRERAEDIDLLCEHFLSLMGKSSPRKTLSAAALDKLCLHDWPGNVRELAHVLERASILADDSPTIRAEDILLRRAPRD